MAAALVDRIWRDSTPENVEDDLAALWRDVAAHGAVARAVMSNLVVFRFRERRTDRGRAATLDDHALDAVVALHPSRAIVIEHDRGEHDPREPIGATVCVCTFGPPSARFGVEELVVRSACAEVSLPSIVRRFVHGQLPTTIWWTEDLSRWPPLPALLQTGRQLVYNSRAWQMVDAGFRTLAPLATERQIDLADLNWRRIAPLRRALVHAAATAHTTTRSARVRIAHRPGDAALAWLLAGWLAARLRWEPGTWAPVEEAAQDEIVILTIGEGTDALVATLDDHHALVRQPQLPPLSVPAARDTEAEAIAAELRSLSHDAALHDALIALSQRRVQ